MIHLRPYQTELLNGALAAWAEYDRVLLQLSTGAGKTEIAMALVQSLPSGVTSCFVVHRKELQSQVQAKLAAHGLDIPVYMVQTLSRRGLTEQYDLIIIDEAHHSVSKSYDKLFVLPTSGPQRSKILGLTATPRRLGGQPLGARYQALVQGPTIQQLISDGFLAEPQIYVPPKTAQLVAEHEGEWKVTAGDYNPKAINQFYEDNQKYIFGDVIAHYKQLAGDKPTIVFCPSVKSVYETVQMFEDNGITAEGIDGSLDPEKRSEILDSFRTNDTKCLVSCDLISEGFDCPEAKVGIFLRPTKSLTVYLQQIGRLLRPSADGSPAVIIDHVNNTSHFGPPWLQRYWSLDGYTARKKTDSVSGLQLKLCTKCGNYVNNSVLLCPHCGNPFKSRLKQFKVLYEQLQCITIESAQKLIDDQCNKILTREKNRMTVRNKEYYLEKAVEWKIKGDHDEWADFKVKQDKENTRIYFEGTEAELLVMFAKRNSCKDPVAETKKALDARKSRASSGKNSNTVAIFESGTDEEILDYIKREKPDVTNPEAYLAGIKRKRLGAVLENGTEEQKAEAAALVARPQEDRFDKMVSFAKSGKMNQKDEQGNVKLDLAGKPVSLVMNDEEANNFAAAVVRKDNRSKIDGGNLSDLLEVAAALHIPEERRSKWADAVLATRK